MLSFFNLHKMVLNWLFGYLWLTYSNCKWCIGREVLFIDGEGDTWRYAEEPLGNYNKHYNWTSNKDAIGGDKGRLADLQTVMTSTPYYRQEENFLRGAKLSDKVANGRKKQQCQHFRKLRKTGRECQRKKVAFSCQKRWQQSDRMDFVWHTLPVLWCVSKSWWEHRWYESSYTNDVW